MTPRFVNILGPASLLLFTGGAPILANSIVLDGGFELPVANSSWTAPVNIGDGWTVTQGEIGIPDVTDGIGVPHSGNQMAVIDANSTVDTLSQALATAVGQSYQVSYWVADGHADALTVNFGAQMLFNGTAPTNGTFAASDYVNYTYIVTATSTTTNLSFTSQYTAGGAVLLDDVSVTPISGTPEPGTFGFGALGCLALLGLASRSRARLIRVTTLLPTCSRV
jgi:hypothetical protein